MQQGACHEVFSRAAGCELCAADETQQLSCKHCVISPISNAATMSNLKMNLASSGHVHVQQDNELCFC